MVVAHEFVEGDEIVGEFLSRRGEKLRRRGIAGEKAGDMIGRAAHQAERRLGPGLGKQTPRAQDRRAFAESARRATPAAPVLGETNVMRSRSAGSAAMSYKHGDRARGAAERRMRGDVLDLVRRRQKRAARR